MRFFGLWKWLTRKAVEADPTPTYAFCETIFSGAYTPWHIRLLGPAGRKINGGADTLSLCGRKVAWDLKVEITDHHLTHCCSDCSKLYREVQNAQ
jgi:hypothetical protein